MLCSTPPEMQWLCSSYGDGASSASLASRNGDTRSPGERWAEVSEPRLLFLILRHHAAHGCPELARVVRVFGVRQLVENDVVHEGERGLDDAPVDAHGPRSGSAPPPFARFDQEKLGLLHVELGRPEPRSLREPLGRLALVPVEQ